MHDRDLDAGQSPRCCDQSVVFGVSAHHIAFLRPRASRTAVVKASIADAKLLSLTNRNASERDMVLITKMEAYDDDID
jgi:hypothetical protein